MLGRLADALTALVRKVARIQTRVDQLEAEIKKLRSR